MGNNKPWAFFWEINFLTSGLGQSTYLHRMDYAEWTMVYCRHAHAHEHGESKSKVGLL